MTHLEVHSQTICTLDHCSVVGRNSEQMQRTLFPHARLVTECLCIF